MHGAARAHGAAVYRLLPRDRGSSAPAAPAALRAAAHRRASAPPSELIDRYQLACRPVRDLLVDYLRERQPALDYTSLEQLGRLLGNCSGPTSSATTPASTACTCPPRSPPPGSSGCGPSEDRHQRRRRQDRIDAERISHRECLTPVRAFYLDLAQWAVEDPARWAPWVAPCPVGAEEINQAQGQAAPQVPDGRPHPRTAARPAGPGPQRRPAARRRAARCCTPPAHARPGDDLHRRRPDPDPRGRRSAARQDLGRRPGHRQAPRPDHRGRPRVLGLGRRRGAARHRHPRSRNSLRAHPPQPGPVPAAHHRRARAAAADRPVQDRRRTAPGRQPRTRRRARRHHQPGPRHQPAPSPSSPPTTSTSASGCRPPRCCSSAASAPRTGPSAPPPSATCSPPRSPAPG